MQPGSYIFLLDLSGFCLLEDMLGKNIPTSAGYQKQLVFLFNGFWKMKQFSRAVPEYVHACFSL